MGCEDIFNRAVVSFPSTPPLPGLGNTESFYQRKVKSPKSAVGKDLREELFICRCQGSSGSQSPPSSFSPAP